MHIVEVLHHVALLHKVLITTALDAFVRLLLAMNLQMILQLIVAQKARLAPDPVALERLGVRVILVDVQVDVVLALRGELALAERAAPDLFARVQHPMQVQAAVCFEIGVAT